MQRERFDRGGKFSRRMEFAATTSQNLPSQVGGRNRPRAVLRLFLPLRTTCALYRQAGVAAV